MLARHAMTVLLGCIADDFTGAPDLANNLVRAGMRAPLDALSRALWPAGSPAAARRSSY